jgi:hypothetical protein
VPVAVGPPLRAPLALGLPVALGSVAVVDEEPS